MKPLPGGGVFGGGIRTVFLRQLSFIFSIVKYDAIYILFIQEAFVLIYCIVAIYIYMVYVCAILFYMHRRDYIVWFILKQKVFL